MIDCYANHTLLREYTPDTKKAQGNESTICLAPTAIHCLEEWMQDHSHNLYLNKDQKKHLLAQTSLTNQQLRSWYERAWPRHRKSNDKLQTRCTLYPQGTIVKCNEEQEEEEYNEEELRWRRSVDRHKNAFKDRQK